MRILITAGPTLEYLDEVRYLSNASSGRMGFSLAQVAVRRGHQVTLVSGPVSLSPPEGVDFIRVTSGEEMFRACRDAFESCDGVIAAAAVCDYRPARPVTGKIKKTGKPLVLEFVETLDILAELGRQKGHRWMVGFAVESENSIHEAARKLHRKNCDAILLNPPSAMGSEQTQVEIIDRSGRIVHRYAGFKHDVAEAILDWIEGAFVRH